LDETKTVKAILAILCGLSLILGQTLPVSAGSCATAVKTDCGCGGQMACCAEKSAPTSPAPASTERAGSENQIVSLVPATVVWVLAAAGTSSLSPVKGFAAPLPAAPLFARHCSRLI
jgi:hypothetical protein